MPAGPRHSQNIILQQLEQLSHHEITLLFSETVGAADEYMQGGGALKGDGFPMPVAGFLRFIAGYHTAGSAGGSPIYIPSPNLFTFVAGDRISCYWDYDAPYGSAWVRKNGATWNVGAQYAQVGPFTATGDMFVTVVLRLHKTIS